jgi:hypothetical protein
MGSPRENIIHEMKRPGEKTRILLVYSSEIQSQVVTPSIRVAPIGLFFINGYLKNKGYETRILHLKTLYFTKPLPDAEHYKEGLRREILEFDPHYIGYSFRNLFHWGSPNKDRRELINYLSMSLEKPTVEFLREITRAPIIGGGSGFSLAPKLYMDYLKLDYGIIGEGELAVEELISRLRMGEDVSELPGLVYRKREVLTMNPPSLIKNLDTLPGIDISDMGEYRELYYDNGGYANIQTKRGCSFRCIYCVYPFLEGNKYRLRDIATVIKEVMTIKKRYDIQHFFIVDSIFSTPAQHSFDFCEGLIKARAEIEWNAHINPINITKKLLEKYKESGCHNLIFTPDTLSKRVLKSYGKDFSIDDVKESIQLLHEVDIPFEVSLILGGPGEDGETVEETVAFCDAYLKDVPVILFDGMWLHPSAPALAVARGEGRFSEAERIDFDEIILSNDFKANSKLSYFFPDVKKKRGEFLSRIFASIRKYKRVVVGKDFIADKDTGSIRHVPELGVFEHQRPWHKGMRGRM